MVKQAMEMKTRMEELKERLGNETVEASAGGGMVKVVMSGKFDVLEVTIDREIVNPDDTEMLETLVRAGMNDAVQKVQELVKSKMGELAGGIDIPGLTS
jgi:DNA-binding YbaB/EbfC family protein